MQLLEIMRPIIFCWGPMYLPKILLETNLRVKKKVVKRELTLKNIKINIVRKKSLNTVSRRDCIIKGF